LAVSASLTNSAAADTVNWRQFEGTSITWAYDIHPYADALAAQLSGVREADTASRSRRNSTQTILTGTR
ncbi:hypothetical protein, partial [Mesorhizobium sp. M5C.F.Ca.ET.164.01.1.1]|uniref:hypothetical protein n=1 Tax=Mesorhizobium sp. M5C.F.Ca.ET.164.01.1.1 TaxID=2563957 RepID=UPI001FEFEE64